MRQIIPRPPGARAGGLAPWAALPEDARSGGTAELRQAMAELGPPRRSPREDTSARASAVLAPFFDDGNDAWVVLTRRTKQLRVHAGELSFPGGGQEPGEALEDTARREAFEEVALDPNVPEIIGELDHLSTVTSGSFIVPYVAVLPERPVGLVANPGEVDAILEVRLADLLDPAVYREEEWPIFGDWHSIVFFDLGEDVLWGATAAMLRQVLGFLTGTVGRGELGHV